MASATGIPDSVESTTEYEPLMGRPGDATQKENQSILTNFFTGTAVLAQGGIWILAAVVWSGVFSHDLIFFSSHPLLNSFAVLITTQAILLLQPTQTASQKRTGTLIHFGLLVVSNLAFVTAFIVVEINKAGHPETRFTSVHGILGLVTYITIFLQAASGVAQYFFPATFFASVDNGKKVYKWHRVSGYVVLLLQLATITAATRTGYNINILHIRLWPILVALVLVVVGVGARLKRHKLPFAAR